MMGEEKAREAAWKQKSNTFLVMEALFGHQDQKAFFEAFVDVKLHYI